MTYRQSVLKIRIEAKKDGPQSGVTQGGNTSKKKIIPRGNSKPVNLLKQKNKSS